MIAHANLPESGIERNRMRDSLAALRLGHDGLEQFVGLLFDELDSLREELDEEQFRLDEERHRVREAQAQIAAERSQWETDRQHWHDALQKRVVELEKDRLTVASELDSERRRNSEMSQDAAEQQRRFAVERGEWAGELRQLRQLLDAKAAIGSQTSMGSVERRADLDEHPADVCFAADLRLKAADEVDDDRSGFRADEIEDDRRARVMSVKADTRGAKINKRPFAEPPAVASPRPKPVAPKPIQVDPIMGPLLSQFQLLQRDVARRREMKH